MSALPQPEVRHDRVRELPRWRLERIVRSVRDILFSEPDVPWNADTIDAIVDVLRAHDLLPHSADPPSVQSTHSEELP